MPIIYFSDCYAKTTCESLRMNIFWLASESIPFSPGDFFFPFIFISWRLITYNIVVVFAIHWHESAMYLQVFPIPILTPTSLPTPSLWVFPVHQPRALVSCIQPGLVICFTLDNIHVLMLFSRNIPTLPSPTESKSLFCTSVSLFLFC